MKTEQPQDLPMKLVAVWHKAHSLFCAAKISHPIALGFVDNAIDCWILPVN